MLCNTYAHLGFDMTTMSPLNMSDLPQQKLPSCILTHNPYRPEDATTRLTLTSSGVGLRRVFRVGLPGPADSESA